MHIETSIVQCDLIDVADNTMIDCINYMSIMPCAIFKKSKVFILPTIEIDEHFEIKAGNTPVCQYLKEIMEDAQSVWFPVIIKMNSKSLGTVFRYYQGFNLFVQYHFQDEVAVDQLSLTIESYLRSIFNPKVKKFIVKRVLIDCQMTDSRSTLAIPGIIYRESIEDQRVDDSLMDHQCTAALAEYRTLVC